MNLSSLIHDSQRNAKYHRASSAATAPASYSKYDDHRPSDEMVTSLPTSLHGNMSSPVQRYRETPQPPPTPPVEESRCSLPSISSLFSSADGGSPSPSTPGMHPLISSPHASLTLIPVERPRLSHIRTTSDHALGIHRHSYGAATPRSHSRVMLPPSPPLRPDSSFDGGDQSPSASSQYSAYSGHSHYSEHALSSHDRAHAQRPPTSSAGSAHRPISCSYEEGSPERLLYPSPHHMSEHHPQRSLPQSFPPGNLPDSAESGSNPWQHHHYISPSSQAAFPASQDRYICQTCSKAFSRPSSLRIHSHSHTGEKPFRCPHHGCGKAFSVRSNMKRHERGCHASTPSSPM
jgi:uncharacterized Zn-finger protein